ncbi:unnamed protein product [Rhizophagus irregularis]|nr:unnamed protein product [Rhizophagus irregularis]
MYDHVVVDSLLLRTTRQMADLATNREMTKITLYGVNNNNKSPIRILISTTLSYRSGVNQATFDDLMNNKEPSAVRISLNDEEIYRSEDVEVDATNVTNMK